MPPSASAAQETSYNLDGDSGLSALGRDYEKKKQKLLLELQLEYKDYVSKKKESKGRVCDRQHQALSLPDVEEKISMKQRLREERQKEYNLFLQEQPRTRRVTRGAPPVTSKNTQTSTPPHQQESPESRRNAATLTEAGDNRGSPDCRGHGPRRRRRWQIHQPKKTQSSEEELNTDEEEDFDFRRRRRRERSTYEREYREGRGTAERKGRRALQNMREMEALSIRDQSSSDGTWKPGISPTPQNAKTSARSTPPTNKEEKELATGLMIGAVEERSTTQMKKEQYKQELLQQIAERQKNKIKEKKALLKVDATDPGKEPECKEQLGAAPQEHESLTPDVLDPKCDNRPESSPHRAPGLSPLVRFGPAFSQLPGNPFPLSGMGPVQMVPPLDYYAGITGMQGPVAFPWVPVVPPVPHSVSSPDRSRHDAAFYQEGTRNQDPSSNQIQNRTIGGARQEETPPPRPATIRAINGSPLDVEALHADSSRQRRQRTQSYREALRQQVTEKEECTRKENEEKRRDAARLEAELVLYDPWGKGGGGAPIKDKHGNLVSNLYHMHRINNNRMTSLGAEAPVSQQEPSRQSPVQQNRYKEELKQQMEENRRKQAEERERVRLAEEEEEKRLAMERARIQQEYEEEQRREKNVRNKWKPSNQGETRETQEVISKRQKKQVAPQSARQKERSPSPPIPTCQSKHLSKPSRPSSVAIPLKSGIDCTGSSPNTQPVPERKPPIPGRAKESIKQMYFTPKGDMVTVEELQRTTGGQQEVIRELSAIRNFLRREQRELELELGQTETRHAHLNKY